MLRLLPVPLAILLLSAPASAVECAVPSWGEPALARIDARERLDFVRARMKHAALRARIWTYAWSGFLAAATVGQLVVSPFFPAESRIDLYLTAGKSFVGLASLVVLPLRVIGDQRWLEQRLQAAPPGTDVCAQLADAERLLERDAQNQVRGKSPLLIVSALLFNIGVEIIHGLVFDRWTTAAVGLFTGVAVGQALFATKPQDAVDSLRRYRSGDLASPPPKTAPPIALFPSVAPGDYRLNLAVAF
ncbi:MAG: hypothetical protein EXR72_19495 [Myxococcales bacterium]|nr:hypothetical protein [Myxococcales bacterium]